MLSVFFRPKLFIIAIFVLSIWVLFPTQKSYETDHVGLDIQVDKPKIGFFSVGDNFTATITVKNNSNETRYFQITELFRPDVISTSYPGDSNETYSTINASSTVVLHQKFTARSSGLYWLIVGANGFENSTYLGYLISNQSFTDYYIHPSTDVDIMTLAQSTTEGGLLSFIGTIIGGAVSGGVGFFIAWYTNKSQDKERLKDNVYRKLYGYTFRLFRGNLPTNWIVSPEEWTRIEPYELIKMDQKLRSELDLLQLELEAWNHFCNGLENSHVKHEDAIKKILYDAFSETKLLNPNFSITIRDSNYEVEGFLRIFWMSIMNPEIKNSEMLIKTMEEHAKMYDWNRLGDIAYLKEKKPLFFDIVTKQLPLLREMGLVGFNYADMMKLREKIRNHVRTLNSELEKLAK